MKSRKFLIFIGVVLAALARMTGVVGAEEVSPNTPSVEVIVQQGEDYCRRNHVDVVFTDDLGCLRQFAPQALEAYGIDPTSNTGPAPAAANKDEATSPAPVTTNTSPASSSDTADATVPAPDKATDPADCQPIDGATAFVDRNGKCTWNGSAPAAPVQPQVSNDSPTATTSSVSAPSATDSPAPADETIDQQAADIARLGHSAACDIYQTGQDYSTWSWKNVSFGVTDGCTSPLQLSFYAMKLVVPYGDPGFFDPKNEQPRVAFAEGAYGPGHYDVVLNPTGLSAPKCQLDINIDLTNRTNKPSGPCGEAPPEADTPPPVVQTPPPVIEQPPTPEAPPTTTTTITVPPTTTVTVTSTPPTPTLPITGDGRTIGLIALGIFLMVFGFSLASARLRKLEWLLICWFFGPGKVRYSMV